MITPTPSAKCGVRSAELLVQCPLCQQSGFTIRLLRAHYCKRKKAIYRRRGGAPLTKAEWQAAIDAARKPVEMP